ncbi:MAG: glycosyltransferase family 9 protein [Candidatus Methylomirabilales bacterium]
MREPRPRLGEPRRIAVFRALQVGDVLCAVPALRALRRAHPRAEITLIGLPWTRALLPRFGDYLDAVLEFPGYPGLPERPPALAELPGFLAAAQARRFDLLLQMHGAGTLTNPLVACLGAARLAGFYQPGRFCPDAETFLPYPEGEHEIRRLLRLLGFLGIPPAGEHLEFPLRPEDRASLGARPDLARLPPGGYACIHPGARSRTKCWPPEHFAAVADRLAEAGLAVVLTGAGRETDLTQAVRRRMRAGAVDAARHDLPLGPLAALLAGARVLVSNDTGVSHLAAALGVPSVVIFSASDPARWAPLDGRRHRALQAPGGVRPDEAVRAAAGLLGLRPPAGPSPPRREPAAAAVDVLIPTYRRPAALAITLTSLCAQTFRDFRVVISDQTEGADPLEAREVLTPLRLLRVRGHAVETHKHLPRRGIAEHRDFLLAQVRAPYCLFLDDDLILEPDVIGRLHAAIREEGCGFVGCGTIGLSYLEDRRPEQQRIEFWEGPVQPELIRPGTAAFARHHLHSAANLLHLQQRLGLTPERQRKYRVAWVGACALYDTAKLRAVGGFGFWRDLPSGHAGEDVLVQWRLMAAYGGCGVIPSGVYHQELPTTIEHRDADAPYVLGRSVEGRTGA